MQPRSVRRLMVAGIVAGAVLVHAAPVAATSPTAPQPTLEVVATDETGAVVDAVTAGEHWYAVATLTPYEPGESVTIEAARGGQVVAEATVAVQPDATATSGRAVLAVRDRQPGQVTLTSRHTASAALPAVEAAPSQVLVRTAGRPRAGCRAPAVVVTDSRLHPALLSTGPARAGMLLFPGAAVDVPAGGRLRLRRQHADYRVAPGRLHVDCADVSVDHGEVLLTTDPRGGSGTALLLHGAVVSSPRPGTRLDAWARPAHVLLRAGAARVSSAAFPASWLEAQPGDVVMVGTAGLPRLDTWPFARSPGERSATRRDALPAFWADGLACSVGCRPPGTRSGWPLKPFHAQHPLRSGLNELRSANLHIGIDIQALDGTRVYATQSGPAHLAGVGTVDERVQVGSYLYWHLDHRVRDGEYVHAYATVIGTIRRGAGHLHLSDQQGGRFLNPLRPGGRTLAPWRDGDRPVIGAPVRVGPGRLDVEVFDPQSFRATIRYRTPVLAPAAVAYRAQDRGGHWTTPLRFALRGSQHLATGLRDLIYAPGAHAPDNPDPQPAGWACFWRWVVCVPRWDYRLAGGLAPPLPPGAAAVTVYAWDWAGNVDVRRVPLA